jgi:hypothetical protein
MKGRPLKVPFDVQCRILKEYQDGARVSDIAAKYGVSLCYASKLAERSGMKMRGKTGPRRKTGAEPSMPPEPKPMEEPAPLSCFAQEIRRLAAKGLGLTKIAALLRCPYREVAAVLEAQ